MDKETVILKNQSSSQKLTSLRKSAARRLTSLIVRIISRTAITPNAVTWSGFAISLGAAVLVATGNLFIGGFAVIIGGFLDMVDGALARSTNRVTHFGNVLDSTLDRLSEAAVLVGMIVLFAREQSELGVLLAGLAIVGSIMVSYVRAKAESLGLAGETGLLTRPERVIITALGLLLSGIDYALISAVGIVAVLSFFTAGQRLVSVWRQTKNK